TSSRFWRLWPGPSWRCSIRAKRSNSASALRRRSASSPGSRPPAPNAHLRQPAPLHRSVSDEPAMRVTNRADKALGDVVPGVRRAIYFDAPEGSAQLTFGAAEIDPGKEIPVHLHRVGERYVAEGFFVLEGAGQVRVGDHSSQIRAGSFCVMSPAEGFHSIRNTGAKPLKFVMCFAGTGVQMERKG